jgi:spore germination protein
MKKIIVAVGLLVCICAILSGGTEHTEGFWHRIVWGETLLSISREYRIDLDLLAQVNGIADIDFIKANRKLWIPGFKLVKAHRYIVKPGDFLLGIGLRYGVDVWSIASLNGIFNLDLIYPGQTIYIPISNP